jgi:hypothetical protein
MAATAVELLPFDVWPAGITQAATPANDNALRAEVIARPALSFEATEPSASSDLVDGNLYVLSAAWGDEVTGTLAIIYDGTFYYFIPYEGMVKKIGDVYSEYFSGAWRSVFTNLPNYADDAAASAGGVVVGELYRTTSTLKVRVA